MRLYIPGIATLALILALLPFSASAQQGESGSDPLVATVNGQQIFRSEVLETAKSLPPQYQTQLDQVFPALVDRLVDFSLLAVAADKEGLAEDEEVLRRLAELQVNVMREVYLERQISKRVTDQELRGRYDKFVADNPAQPEVHARHILLEEESVAKEVIVALDGGADFAELARERSTGPSGPQGGDLGYFTQDQMVPEFAQVAFNLEAGSYTKDPVQTQFGWHVIKVEDRRQGVAVPFEELEEQLREEASREVVNTVLGELRENATIEVVDPLPPATDSSQ